MNTKTKNTSALIFLSWLVAIVATIGSLFFSEVMKYYPCVMCWYQRIFMYPMAIIFLISFLQSDTKVVRYTLPLTVLGWAFSVYHLGLYFEIIPETAAPCVEGVSCTIVYIQWLGFITIPMLSFLAFSLLIGLQFLIKRGHNEK
jgi:disulfide bond formation protein DsbB